MCCVSAAGNEVVKRLKSAKQRPESNYAQVALMMNSNHVYTCNNGVYSSSLWSTQCP